MPYGTPRSRPFRGALAVVSLLAAVVGGAAPASGRAATGPTTAWHRGSFAVDTANVVRRSDAVLTRPNTDPRQSMPLGNGTLGAAVWAANGFTAQLNRSGTFPDRRSPGQLVIPGLSKLTGAPDFAGYLDPYDGMLHETGGGMALTAYVRARTAQLVVDVTGADPDVPQTAAVRLWDGRHPAARTDGKIATLAETWTDDTATGASGRTFGSLAGVSAGGRDVTASNPDGLTGQVSFTPDADGSFRVIVAAPAWTGGDALATAASVIKDDATKPASALAAAHLAWWHDYWRTAGLIKITSSDGSGEYVENLRTLYLYDAAAERGGPLPGSQAGLADLFNFSQDRQDWYPAGYWFWNLRMQVQANLSAGESFLNDPVFRLYRDDIPAISAWTAAHMPGREGLCVPETMRFNGNGYYAGGDAASNASCDSTIAPSWNSLTVTTGAEIALWVWQEYLTTDDRSLLRADYPLMSGAARFLLSAATTGSDGYLHTRANAHETQWNVGDPTTDIVAMRALFPVVVRAARTLGVDGDLADRLQAAIAKIPPLPRTDIATKTRLLPPSADADGADMIGPSAEPAAPRHNSENLGLEAVWPYGLIGDGGALTDLAKRTYAARGYVNANDWSFDALQATRLGLASEVRADLLAATESYQIYPSGLASLSGSESGAPYVEQAGVTAATVSEALVQDYDGLLRIAPAWPVDWTGAGTVYVQHGTKVDVQIADGTPSTVAIVAGGDHPIAMRSPWPGRDVTVVDGRTGAKVLTPGSDATFTIPAHAGRSYLVELVSSPTTSLPFAPVGGSPATAVKHLGTRSIGVDSSIRG
ncbi:glycosyl hydrolase family 95 catalytic domain-containing protein [Actinoallomurus acaciae]|uniref:Glycosyl hydrolase family 95 catalytic domain-containing protein n=1 Tax=Actinoallomurus acaciae TaxID=502577 RepID=A0ABV5YG87_9ACTN